MPGYPQPQDAAKLAPQRRRDLLDMRERQADFFAPGDHDAVWVEQAKPGKRHALRFDNVGRQPRAERDEGRVGRSQGG